MDSPSIVIVGILLVSGGSALLLYTRSRPHFRSEVFLNGLGVALVACGLAVIRDGATGSRHILWMLHDQTHHASAVLSSDSELVAKPTVTKTQLKRSMRTAYASYRKLRGANFGYRMIRCFSQAKPIVFRGRDAV